MDPTAPQRLEIPLVTSPWSSAAMGPMLEWVALIAALMVIGTALVSGSVRR